MQTIIGTIYTTTRFEALIRDNRTGDIEMKELGVKFPSSVIYLADGEEKIADHVTMTQVELWNAAVANAQPLITYGETGELISIRKRETTIERKDRKRERSLFDPPEEELTETLRNEANERYDQMIGR